MVTLNYEKNYPLLVSLLRTSSKLSTPLYRIPVTIPSGFDNVTWTMPLSITTCTCQVVKWQHSNFNLDDHEWGKAYEARG